MSPNDLGHQLWPIDLGRVRYLAVSKYVKTMAENEELTIDMVMRMRGTLGSGRGDVLKEAKCCFHTHALGELCE